MKNKFIVTLLALMMFVGIDTYAQHLAPVISDRTNISFIVCEPGDEVYSAFGHAAIRVTDPLLGTDLCFHWGIFSFYTDNFIYKFVKGETDYMMGIYPYEVFIKEYVDRESTVYDCRLNLTLTQKEKLYALLLENYKPQNRTYRYNYVFDNCATRPLDLILSVSKGIKQPDNKDELSQSTSFRDIIWSYVHQGSMLSAGIDLVVGSQADNKTSLYQQNAFPMYAMKYLERCTINGNPLIEKPYILYQGKDRTYSSHSILGFVVTAILFLIALGFALYYRKNQAIIRHAFATIVAITSIIGCLIAFLMFFSEHPLVTWNYNFLWLNPLSLALIYVIYAKPSKTTKYIALIFNCATWLYSVLLIMDVQSPCIPVIGLWALYSTIIFLTYKNINRQLK